MKRLDKHLLFFFFIYTNQGVLLNGIIEMKLQRNQHFNVGLKKMHGTFTQIINML